MRQIYLFAAFAFLAACGSNPDKTKTEEAATTTDTTSTVKQETLTYPYTADYSSDFEIGDAKNAQTLLQVYKDWDDNKTDNFKNSFAEVDTMYFSDGTMFAGGRDSLVAMAGKARAQMGTVVDSVHAWVPLRSKNKNENWVAIWTREISTDAKGKKTAKELHEVWRFDNNGKINLVYQYEQRPPKMPPPPPKKK
ncbi:hypothetical protein [Flavihumibacter petaseus]|uniref:SnoaL-like domain-containing protein n=1 Tax=Flavihumibacter petaseus NBRC 106054 TaxID=1220578 RepID=A0A0E9N201_9BACT|nr:hypothetical protein [Flavihumibacter petaseus]GAO43823.1 hypothetical protein FPE01S_02_09290 [Flavihumibacter petaseus NBRC 106054]